jgi:hypothetical protein
MDSNAGDSTPYHVSLTWPKECRQEPSDERFAGPDEQKQYEIALYVG